MRLRLIDDLAGLYASTRTLGFSLDEVERLTLEQASPLDDYQATLKVLNAVIRELASLGRLPPNAREQVEALQETWTRYRPLLPTEPRIEDAPFFDECLEALLEAKVEKRAKAVKELATSLEEQLNNLGEVFYDVCGRETLRALVEILRRIDVGYQKAKAQQNGLDYEDLQIKVRDLFRTHPWLARHYAERYQFVLVDEFQDTNGLQKEILDLLTSQDSRLRTQDPRPKTNVFIVGDAKQSIYGWRGAAVEVFAEAAQELEERGATDIVLEKNFRSTESLIRFFNEFFSRLMVLAPDQNASVMQRLGYVEFILSQAERGASPHPPVELILEVGEHVKNVDEGRELEAARLAGRIAQMVQGGECLIAESAIEDEEKWRPVRYGDIAILFRAMTDIKVYERALRQRGIPYYVLAGKGFYQREEIQDLLSLLRFIENRTDEIALVSALRSPLFGISDETLYWLRQYAEMRSRGVLEHHPLLSGLLDYQGAWGLSPEQLPLVAKAAEALVHLLEQRNRVPLADLLEDILSATNYEAIQATFYDGHQRVANLRKLVELARGFEERGPHFLRDFIHFVAQFTEMETRESEAQIESGADDVVQVMTVHKAKGLEFPVVIIPDVARRFQARADGLAFDRGLGIGMKEPDRRGRLHPTRLRRRVEEQIKQREFFENQRLLFVAATRAKDYLILAGASPKLKSKEKNTKSEHQVSVLQEATSWLEWIGAILNINDPQSLPEIYEWQGIRLRVSPGGDVVAETREAADRIIDRFTETRRGDPVPAHVLPVLAEPDQQIFHSIAQLIESVMILPVTSPQPLAVTRLLSFAQCPLKYYYESVLGLPGSDEEDSRPKSQDPRPESLSASARGQIVHRFCEIYDGSEAWEPLLQQLVNEEVVTIETGDLEIARGRAFTETKPLVERYLHSELWHEMEQILWGGQPGRVQSEVEFVYHTGTLPLRGRIDKLIIHGDGRATVVDFKTNRITPEQVEEVARAYELQMRIYALAARQALRLDDVRGEFYFLEPNVRFQVDQSRLDESPTAREIDELCRQILNVREIQDAIARPSPDRCRRCSCFSFCPSRAG
jgi:ATP-dependent helicase/nuclease subunit A